MPFPVGTRVRTIKSCEGLPIGCVGIVVKVDFVGRRGVDFAGCPKAMRFGMLHRLEGCYLADRTGWYVGDDYLEELPPLSPFEAKVREYICRELGP